MEREHSRGVVTGNDVDQTVLMLREVVLGVVNDASAVAEEITFCSQIFSCFS